MCEILRSYDIGDLNRVVALEPIATVAVVSFVGGHR